MRQLQCQGDLRIRDHPLMQEQVLDGDIATVPDDAFQTRPPDGAQTPYPAPYRNAGALYPGH